jgi:hypothetical protein
MPKHSGPFALVARWRAKDQHTGIDKDRGIPYTYEHIDGRAEPAPRAEVYRVESFIPYGEPTPLHRNVHYVPGPELDAFFDGWGEHGETVIDVRPLTIIEARAELAAFRAAAESRTMEARQKSGARASW